jgi:hypothetical protein
MATKHTASTGKEHQAGQKQAAAKHEAKEAKPKARKQQQDKNRVKDNPNETPPVGEQHEANFEEGQVAHRDEREFVGQMDGAQANKEMEGRAPFDRSQHDRPEDFDRAEDTREAEKSKAGSLPIENEHRARDHAGRRHQ